MSKKKGRKQISGHDFTLNDCANAPTPVNRIKKVAVIEPVTDLSWDQVDHYDVAEEVGPDGVKSIVLKKKLNCKLGEESSDDRPGIEYPEIVWYLISQYVSPEDVGNFAGINRSTYTITQKKSFWLMLYKRYCRDSTKLPEKLQIENNYKFYGLRQRVIRALYHTHEVFTKKVQLQATQDSWPHGLIKRRCINVWYHKGPLYWLVFFKLKKINLLKKVEATSTNFLEELDRIDANPDENCQVLQVACQNFYEVPPLLGMTLSSVKVVLEKGFSHHRLMLGFSSCHYSVSRDIVPECSVVMGSVVKIQVLDWWHPNYPHTDNSLPTYSENGKAQPVLKKDFFAVDDT